jgi:hypothetical protein
VKLLGGLRRIDVPLPIFIMRGLDPRILFGCGRKRTPGSSPGDVRVLRGQ